MVRSREELSKSFSDETIDHEIERVKKSNDGEILYFMETWESADLVDTILFLAEIVFYTTIDNGLRYYIKGAEEQT